MVLVHSVSDVDVVIKSGINVIQTMFHTSLGLGLGIGMGYLIMGYSNSSEYAQQSRRGKTKMHFPISPPIITILFDHLVVVVVCSRSGGEISGM